MKTVIIGAGNVATHLAIELYKHNYTIVQIYSRTIESANELAKMVDSQAVNTVEAISTEADLYIYAIKDSVLENLITSTPQHQGISIHTAGSMPMSLLGSNASKYGVIYPMQTFSKQKGLDWSNIPLFIEGSDSDTLKQIEIIANTLSNSVIHLSTEKRKYVHASAVFACNFTNHMYALAEGMLRKADLPFDVLLPLIDETCAKVHQLSPHDAQTGPAIRFDENVMNKHLELVEDEKTKELYKLISESIHKAISNSL